MTRLGGHGAFGGVPALRPICDLASRSGLTTTPTEPAARRAATWPSRTGQADHQLVQIGQPALPLAHDLRLERTLTVSGDGDLHLTAGVGDHRLRPVPVARVPQVPADRIRLVVAQMLAELFLQGRLQNRLGQRLQQPTRAGQRRPLILGLADQARHHGDLVQTQSGLQQRLEKNDRSNARQTLEDLERDGNDEGVVEEAEDAVNQNSPSHPTGSDGGVRRGEGCSYREREIEEVDESWTRLRGEHKTWFARDAILRVLVDLRESDVKEMPREDDAHRGCDREENVLAASRLGGRMGDQYEDGGVDSRQAGRKGEHPRQGAQRSSAPVTVTPADGPTRTDDEPHEEVDRGDRLPDDQGLNAARDDVGQRREHDDCFHDRRQVVGGSVARAWTGPWLIECHRGPLEIDVSAELTWTVKAG